MIHPCQIIGVLDNGIEGLTPVAQLSIESADLVIGGTRTLGLFAQLIEQKQTRDFTALLTQVPSWIADAQLAGKKVVVLATGDPLCHGIAGFLGRNLGVDALQILPNVSAVQLAFSRFGLSWQDAQIVSIHTKDTGEWQRGADQRHGLYGLMQALCLHSKLAVLTSPENNPARIARMLIIARLDQQFDMYIAEDLLYEEECLFQDLSTTDIADQQFNGNDVVILIRKQPLEQPVMLGLADDTFQQRKPEKGLITKREVRAVSLARMQLKATSIVWDIGAGSGSVGLEAARLCYKGHIYAIEKNAADIENAEQNAELLKIHNYTLVHAKAPERLDEWLDPDAVFFGGSGGELEKLIEYCLQRLKPEGWLVMNFVTIENLQTAVSTLKNCQAVWDVTQLQASRSQPILHMHRFSAENPVWVVSACRSISL
jgi:precorrin-6Y C5,15-methyltransferase (decarboxylating)